MVGSGYVVKLGDFGMARAMYDSDYYRFGRKGKANILPCSYFLLGAMAGGGEGGGLWGYRTVGADRDLWHWRG